MLGSQRLEYRLVDLYGRKARDDLVQDLAPVGLVV
jgi:hypothetical protein